MVSAYEPKDFEVELVWDEDPYVTVGFDDVTCDTRAHAAALARTVLIKAKGYRHGRRPSKVVFNVFGRDSPSTTRSTATI